MASNTTREVLFDLSPVLIVYTDGTVERLMGTPNVPPSPEDSTTGVASKDIIVLSPEVKARLFLPKLVDPTQKLPVLVYYHGGGFIVDSPYCLNFHRYMNILAAEAKALIISVEYRLAPEHLLPIAYEDSWTAIQWVASHAIANANIEKDPWVTKHGDFGKLYIGGDSAGANIAHNIVLRTGVEPLPGDVKILGLFLSCPYFWGSKPVGSQSKNDLKGFAYKVWMCVYPSAAGGIDNPMINPFAEDAPCLSGLACSRLLVCLAVKDAFTPRGILYVETMKKSGWNGEMQLAVVDGEDHEFHVNDPYSEKAKDLIQNMASFISKGVIYIKHVKTFNPLNGVSSMQVRNRDSAEDFVDASQLGKKVLDMYTKLGNGNLNSISIF
ncbi:2-hydroxyisoflavanone dehydratase-like [Olea europaea subsp. europaea]|uniref:2-hydroxyisoflavanone dehydratase-like n=1 Tax=Olea europaea subsp. europaea TaxID=158383 RepID=A0A8S0UPJ5_OLEEU|nr:2-hydroxyisoflavanone dehydratase-like [Olea europaea subsp. europaea]